MISIVGLMLALVGAVLLAWGLFRPTLPLYPGFLRNPSTAAADQAFGGSGGSLLVVGFLVQAVPMAGVSQPTGATCGVLAGIGSLAGGALIGWLLYGVVYIHRFRVEMERFKALDEQAPDYVRRRSGLRFWNFDARRDG